MQSNIKHKTNTTHRSGKNTYVCPGHAASKNKQIQTMLTLNTG